MMFDHQIHRNWHPGTRHQPTDLPHMQEQASIETAATVHRGSVMLEGEIMQIYNPGWGKTHTMAGW